MEKSKLYDVLIVGAGPVGSHIAAELASLGYRVAVFEEHEQIGQPACCTGIIGRDCAERFRVPQDLLREQANSAKLFTPSGNWLRLWKKEPQAYIIDRAIFDVAWAKQAQRQGADFFLGCQAGDIAVSNSGIMMELEQQGEKTRVNGQTAVLATGFASKLPQQLGFGQLADFVIGAQAEVERKSIDEVEIYFGNDIAPGFFAWLVPTSQGRALAGLFSRKNPSSCLKQFLALLYRQGKIASARAKISYDGIPLRPRARTYKERVLVVGEAAGQVKPTTGGGVYYGLLCAEIAAETIHQALSHGDFSENLFSQYEKRWKKRLGWELRVGYWARRIYERLNDGQIEEVFRVIKAQNIHERLLQSSAVSFDQHGKLLVQGLQLLAPWYPPTLASALRSIMR